MFRSTLKFIIIIHMFLMCLSYPGQMLGPGVIIFKSFEKCDPPKEKLQLLISQKKWNRTTDVMDMTLSTPWPLNDNTTVEIKAESKKEGGYKPGVFYMKGPFCHTLKKIAGDLFQAILAATGVEDCPMPGDIKVSDFYLDNDKMNDPMLFGDYKAEITFFVKEEVIGCYLMYYRPQLRVHTSRAIFVCTSKRLLFTSSTNRNDQWLFDQ